MGEAVTDPYHLDAEGEARLHRAMRACWHPVISAAELGAAPQPVELLGERLVVGRMGDALFCFRDLCAHRGSELSKGWIDGAELICPYHGWSYGLDGKCTRIPARFGLTVPSKAKTESFSVVERFGLVWVCLASDPGFPVPGFPEYDDPSFEVTHGPTYDWLTSAHRRVENFIDWSHLPFIHDGTLGVRDRPEVPDAVVERRENSLFFATHLDVPLGPDAELVPADYEYSLWMPLTVHLIRIESMRPDERYILFMSSSPLDRGRCRNFWMIATNSGRDVQSWLDMESKILEQDRPVVEGQRPEALPVDFTAELHIRGIDRASIDYRRWLSELVRGAA